MLKSLRFIAVLAALVAGPVLAGPVVPGEPARASKALVPPPVLRLAPKAAPTGVRLPPVSDAELSQVRAANARAATARKRVAVGIERDARSQQAVLSSWTAVAGGYAAQLPVTSPGAGAMRVAVDLTNVPLDVEMVFFGSDAPGRLVGPVRVGDIKDRMQPWWSPLTDGETQTIEFFAPARAAAALPRIRVTAASHVFTTAASAFTKRLADIGDAGACEVDIKCSSLQSSSAFMNVRNAVAQMVFNDSGTIYLCTGTLLNDTAPASQVPWFYSANHCFDNETLPVKNAAQMQGVANTLTTLWFFEAQSCNSNSVGNYVQLTGGAQYLYNSPSLDVLFLRLNDAAPAGAFFSAWSANALTVGASVITIHHPKGDLKKVSEGSVIGSSNPPVVGGTSTAFPEVRYTSGSTEGGSSGAGLFTFDGSQYLLRGALWGGSALCSNSSGTDEYSRLDLAYPQISQYLNNPNSPAYDYTDLWWNPNESGWGLNLIQHATGVIFAIWYTYDANGKKTWYHVPSGTWSSSTSYSGTLYAVSGPSYDKAFDPNSVTRTAVGTATLNFSDANNGTWTYSVNGVSGTKAITRLSF